MTQAFRFALDPTPARQRVLASHAGAARFAWNWGLAACQDRYAAEGKWWSGTELHRLWNAAKKTDTFQVRHPVEHDRRRALGALGVACSWTVILQSA